MAFGFLSWWVDWLGHDIWFGAAKLRFSRVGYRNQAVIKHQ
jgi:hypothetical protein